MPRGPFVSRELRGYEQLKAEQEAEAARKAAQEGQEPPAAAPIALEVAVERMETAAGAPLASFLSKLDPTPIDSTAIACTYQGMLLDGERVILRVLRPDANVALNRERLGLAAFLKLLDL